MDSPDAASVELLLLLLLLVVQLLVQLLLLHFVSTVLDAVVLNVYTFDPAKASSTIWCNNFVSMTTTRADTLSKAGTKSRRKKMRRAMVMLQSCNGC